MNTTIVLDGGRTAPPMRYYIRNYIFVSSNIRIVALNGSSSSANPVITKLKHVNSYSYVFVAESSSSIVSISFRSIRFEDINIIFCNNVHCSVIFEQCKIILHDQPSRIPIIKNTRRKLFSVTINNCIVKVRNGQLIHSEQTWASIHIEDTIIEGSGGVHHKSDARNDHSPPFHLAMKNVVVRDQNIQHSFLYVEVKIQPNISIVNTIFKNMKSLGIIYLLCVGRKCRIRSSPGVVVKNTLFVQCTAIGNILALYGQSLHFRNSTIQNSSALKIMNFAETFSSIIDVSINSNTNRFDSFTSVMRFAKNSTIFLANTMVSFNNISRICFATSSTIKMENVTLSNNCYNSRGIYFGSSNVELKNLKISENIGIYEQKIFVVKSWKWKNLLLKNITITSSQQQKDTHPLVTIAMDEGELNVNQLFLYLKEQRYIAIKVNGESFKWLNFVQFNVFVSCPRGSNPYVARSKNIDTNLHYIVKCNYCKYNSYALKGGDLWWKGLDSYGNVKATNTTIPCLTCPNGGNCEKGVIKSRGNFYGFKESSTSVKYITCPTGYCCSNRTECTSYNTCARNRRGVLCGQCEHGYQENLFVESYCIKSESCRNKAWFWLLFTMLAIFDIAIIIYLDMFPIFLKQCISKLKHKLLKCLTSTNDDPEQGNTNEMITTNQDTGSDTYSNILDTSNIEVVPADNDEERSYTTTAVLTALISYYQVKTLLTVLNTYRQNNDFFRTISRIFNGDLLIIFTSSLCPMANVDTVTKNLIKNVLFNVSLPLLIVVIFSFNFLVSNVKERDKGVKFFIKNELHSRKDIQRFNYRFIHRLGVAYIRTLWFIYKNLTFCALTMIHCVTVNDKIVLFIQGNRECYAKWQYALMVFLGCWVIPFPIALWESYHLFLEKKKITFFEMLLSITVPLVLPFYLLRSHFKPSYMSSRINNPILNRMIKDLLTEPYRHIKSNDDRYVFWESWRLIQRLMLATIATFVINPLERSCFLMPVVALFMVVYFKVLPFKQHLKLLHWLEVISLVSFCFVIVVSVFDGFFFSYNIPIGDPVPILSNFFVWVDAIVSPITLLVFYFMLWPLWKAIYSKIF